MKRAKNLAVWALSGSWALVGCAGGTAPPAAPEQAASTAQATQSSESGTEASPSSPAASVEEESVAATVNDAPSAGPAEAVAAPPREPTPLPVGTKVLHVGDSFAGALGLPLGQALEARGLRSVLKHTDASYLTTWAWEGALGDYLRKYNPDLVLVTLGANELAIVEPEQRSRAIRKIVETIGDRPCVWVAIPLWKGPQNGLLEVIRRESAPCHYLDTNALLDTAQMPRISDGIHPTASARKQWAEVVIDWLAKERDPNGPRPWSLRAPR